MTALTSACCYAPCLQAPRNDKETDSMPGSIPWENCTKAGAAAFAPPPGNKYLHNNLVTLVSKLRLELADVWARWGEETCIVLHAVHLFNALNANRCAGKRKVGVAGTQALRAPWLLHAALCPPTALHGLPCWLC